jgi:serine/threonine protein kinase
MTLQPGARLGSYEVVGLLGAGGMGEVYRARDTQLKREVAIKALPATVSRDPERLSRFQREAEILASLTHPNIGAIHHLEEVEGTPFLILELIEGDTLAERITRGPLPLDEALTIARQIAQAVEAAHAKGVVHRDLKPANVKITPDQQVKVLDFGLAKMYEAQPESAAFSNSPTRLSGTMTGTLIGTAAYMSPEQARGQNADRQSDVWAFGCILYEMLSGKPAFGGNTVTDILAGVVRAEPNWNALPSGIPPRILLLMKRCLQKDRTQRLRDLGDAALEIDTKEEAPAVSSVRSRKSALPWAIAAIAVLLAAAVWITSSKRTTPPAKTVRFTVPPPAQFFQRGQPTQLALSPDGNYLAFVAEDTTRNIWLRSLDSAEAKPVPGTSNGSLPFWSPDSRYLGFWRNQQMYKVSIADGHSQVISAADGFPVVTWNRNNVIVYSADGKLFRVSADGGTPEKFMVPDQSRKETQLEWPQFFPDDDHFLFSVVSEQPEAAGLWVISMASRERKRLLPAPARAKYSSATGDLLYIRDGRIVSQPFDDKRLEFSGQATVLNLGSSEKELVGTFDISTDGILVWNSRAQRAARLVWRDRNGNKTDIALESGSYRQVRLSPDGARAAVQIVSQQNQRQEVWVYETVSSVFSPIPTGPAGMNDMVWAPDGRQLAFISRGNLYRTAIGSSEIIPMIESPVSKWLHDWSPDGRSIVFAYDRGVYVTSATNPGASSVFLENNSDKDEFRVSPDNKWMAYNSDESGRSEVYVASFPKFDNRRQISNSGGAIPRWRGDMREMYYMREDGTVMAVDVRNGDTLETGAPRPLFHADVPVSSVLDQYDVTRDGQKFLIVENDANAVSPPIHVLVNWAKK